LGGLLGADLLRKQYSDQKASIFLQIIACIAYDTPVRCFLSMSQASTEMLQYLGINGSICKNIASNSDNSTSSTSQQADQCSNIKWAQLGKYALGCSFLAGSAGVAIVCDSIAGISAVTVGGVALLVSGRVRRDFSRGLKWTTDYCKYLKDNLFNKDLMKKRVDDLMKIEQDDGVLFRVFVPPCFVSMTVDSFLIFRLYATLPGGTPPRTFIVLPEPASQAAKHFLPATNKLACNEIMAHTGMFCRLTNDGYDELGRSTINLIRYALMK
jgi:hypothetical protein